MFIDSITLNLTYLLDDVLRGYFPFFMFLSLPLPPRASSFSVSGMPMIRLCPACLVIYVAQP